MKEQKEEERAKWLGRNTQFLRAKAGLTVQGAAVGIDISPNHLRLIEGGESNITARTAGKICDFFNIDIATLYGKDLPPTMEMEEMPAVQKFYNDNVNNPQFFISAKDENSVAYFLREVLLKEEKFFRKGKWEVGEVVDESNNDKHRKNFKSKAVSLELLRLVRKGLLDYKDKTGNGTVFLYFEPE